MTWFNVVKRPMMEVAGGKEVPMEFGTAESSRHFEMNLDKLASELNALDLNVKIIQMKEGYIDPTITHEVKDAEGKEKTIMSNSPRGMEYGSKKKVWQGLRLITERRIGDLKQKELRKRFPMYHIDGPMTQKLDADAKLREQYPEAVEYFFSPKQELITIQRNKHKRSTPRYGASQRTVEQHNRWLEEAKKYNLLDSNGEVNETKFTSVLRAMIEDAKPFEMSPRLEKKILQHLEQFVREIPTNLYINISSITDKMKEVVFKYAIVEHKKAMIAIVNEKRARNGLIAEFVGKGSQLLSTFQRRVYDVAIRNLESNIAQMISEAKKDSSWPDINQTIRDSKGKGTHMRNVKNFSAMMRRQNQKNKSEDWKTQLKLVGLQ